MEKHLDRFYRTYSCGEAMRQLFSRQPSSDGDITCCVYFHSLEQVEKVTRFLKTLLKKIQSAEAKDGVVPVASKKTLQKIFDTDSFLTELSPVFYSRIFTLLDSNEEKIRQLEAETKKQVASSHKKPLVDFARTKIEGKRRILFLYEYRFSDEGDAIFSSHTFFLDGASTSDIILRTLNPSLTPEEIQEFSQDLQKTLSESPAPTIEEHSQRAPARVVKVCSFCEKKLETSPKCGRCKTARYCGTECQQKHWKQHKKECRYMAFLQSVSFTLETQLPGSSSFSTPPSQ